MKKFLMLLVVLGSLFAIASCGGNPTPKPEEEINVVPLDTNKEISIEFWHAMGQVNQEIIASKI